MVVKWEDFKKTNEKQYKIDSFTYGERQTNIECPKCNSLLYVNDSIVLASYPPQKRYYCKNCGFADLAYA